MIKKGISPDFKYTSIPGSFNMNEQRVFLGSKMMDIEDLITLDSRDIIYYQQANGEQIDLNQEETLDPIIHSIVTDKSVNHGIDLDVSQSDLDKNNKTKWITEINLRNSLRNYIYAQIKNNRSFAGIKNSENIFKSVNESVYKYIDENIMDRYYIKDIEFFIKYISLIDDSSLKYQTNFNSKIELEENKFTNIRNIFTNDKSMVRIFFTQQKDSKEYTFDYYFNLIFEKK